MPRQTLKKRSDGRYQAYYKGKHFYGKTQKEAQQKKQQYIQLEKQGIKQEAAGYTVAQYCAKWLPTHKSGVSENTYAAYAGIINRMIKEIGSIIIKDVTPDDIMQVYSTMTDMSSSYIKKSKFLYNSIFNSAVASGYCIRNPAKDETVKPSKGSEGTHRSITDEQRQLILTTQHRMRTAALVMLYAGLRRGEMLALSMDDIDLQAGIIHVNKAVRFNGNRPTLVSTKTENGIREVPIFSMLRSDLQDTDGLIFKQKTKDGIATQASFRRAWESYMVALSKAAGHPVSIRPHDLRHSFATWLRDCSVDMKICVKWMGHADEKMIMKIYDHITPKRLKMSIYLVEKFGSTRQNARQDDFDALESLENQRFQIV